MSVIQTMVAVVTTVLTQQPHSTAAVVLDISWPGMEDPVMVRIVMCQCIII